MIKVREVAMIYSDRYITVSTETYCAIIHVSSVAAHPGECYSGYPK